MNLTYQNNIKVLLKRNSPLVAFLDDLETDNYAVMPSSSQPCLHVKRNDGQIIQIGNETNDNLEKMVPKIERPSLCIVMGMGLGGLLFEAVKKNPHCLYIIVEHDARIFKKALETYNFVPYLDNQNIEFWIAKKPVNFVKDFIEYLVMDDHSDYLTTLQSIFHPQNVKWSQSYYQEFTQAVTHAINIYWDGMVGSSYQDSLCGLVHVMNNLKFLPKMMTIEPYRNYYQGAVGIVVSSGPSLNQNLNYIKSVKDRAVIICADSAYKLLLKNGIVPLGVATMERDKEIPLLFEGIDNAKSILFTTIQCEPLVIERYAGPLCCIFRDTHPMSWFPQFLPLMNVGVSCSHLSLLMLLYLGCSEVALVGQDLAYHRETGRSHFSGVMKYASEGVESLEHMMIPDNQGGMIASNYGWKVYAELFSEIVKQFPDRKVFNVIDASAGARIDAVERMDPALFFNRLETISTKLLALDPFLGYEELQKKYNSGFSEKLSQKIRDALKELSVLRENWVNLKNVNAVGDFFQSFDQLQKITSPDHFRFFQGIYLGNIKRFRCAARGLWSDQDFIAHRDDFIEKGLKVLDELVDVMIQYQ